MIDPSFWRGRKVFLTGHTGFKGSWLSIWLKSMGAEVKGYSLKPASMPNLFDEAKLFSIVTSDFNNIKNYSALSNSVSEFKPEIIFHLAAQPLVIDSYKDPLETFNVNVLGTANLLECARNFPSVKAVVNVTTDKCYENKDWVWGYRENDPLGGHDPYSSSKACSELVTSGYLKSFYIDKKIGLASARSGNVLGGGDWSSNRLVPDILDAFGRNDTVVIRNPGSVRPWQHVLEPLSGYLTLAEKLYQNPEFYSGAWNFGPLNVDAREVNWIVEKMGELWPGKQWEIGAIEGLTEARTLKLDISKAIDQLDWHPVWGLEEALRRAVRWYQKWQADEDMHKYCINEINDFTKTK